jgi:predicted nucleotidyltransferase
MIDNSVLSRIIRIIVEAIDPDSIILFGSRASETAHNDSDYVLCILKTGVRERRNVSMQLYQLLWDVGAPVDILIETPDSFEIKKTNPHLIYQKIAKS